MVIVDRNGDLAHTVAAEVGGTAIVGDVADSAFCDSRGGDGRRNVMAVSMSLVNAAGVIVRASGEDTTDEQWAKIMGVNVSGTFFMCRAALRVMKPQAAGRDRQLRFDLG